MVINFHECGSILEQASIVMLIVANLFGITAGFVVYTNESDEVSRKPLLRELLGGIEVFFTGRYLNDKGKKWRIPYVSAVIYIIVWAVYSYFFSIC